MAESRYPRRDEAADDGPRYRLALVALLQADALRAREVRWWQRICGLAGVDPGLVRSPVELPAPDVAAKLAAGGTPRGIVPAPRWLLDREEADRESA